MSHPVAAYFQRRFLELQREDFGLISRIPSDGTRRSVRSVRLLSADQRAYLAETVGLRSAYLFGAMVPWVGSPHEHFYREFLGLIPDLQDLIGRPLVAAKAADLRRAAREVFKAAWDASPVKSVEPGEHFYVTRKFGPEVRLRIRHSMRAVQVYYGVFIDGRFGRNGLTLEGLFGLGVGMWNIVESEDVTSTIVLLREVVERTVEEVRAADEAARQQETIS